MNNDPWFHWLHELPNASPDRAAAATWYLSLVLLLLAVMGMAAWIRRAQEATPCETATWCASALVKFSLYVACLRPFFTWLLCGPNRPPLMLLWETQWPQLVAGLLVLRFALVAARREMPDLFL